jgi:hypothetical protein
MISLLERPIILKDVKEDPLRFVDGVLKFVTHHINVVVDLKGMKSLEVSQMRSIWDSATFIVHWVLNSKHQVLDDVQQI